MFFSAFENGWVVCEAEFCGGVLCTFRLLVEIPPVPLLVDVRQVDVKTPLRRGGE